MTRAPIVLSHRSLIARAVLLLCFALAVGCATESAPAPEVLSLREHLGLSSERVAALDAQGREHFAQQLTHLWHQQAQSPISPLLPPSADEPLSLVRVHDQARAHQDQDALLSAALDAEPDGVHITALALTPDQLGLSLTDALLALRPLAEAEATFEGELSFDAAWGTVEQPSLGGLRELDAAIALDPLLRRALHHLGVSASQVTISPAPRAPLALWYAVDTQTIFINPNILYLFHATPDAPPSPLRTQTASLELPFIDSCINDQRLRCNTCFGPTGDPTLPECAPLFPTSADPTATATQECLDLSSANQFDLYCYHEAIYANLSCFRTQDIDQHCGGSLVPFQSTARLQLLSPMRSDELCQQYLSTCYDAGSTSGTDTSSSGADTSGSTSGSTTQPPSNPQPVPQTSDESCSDDCSESLCDAGIQALVTIACLGLADGSDTCEENDSNSDDNGGCGEETSEQTPSQLPQGALLAFPFAILAGAWWRDRRRPVDKKPENP